MAIASAFGAKSIGLVCLHHSKQPFYILQHNAVKFNKGSPSRIAKKSTYSTAGRMSPIHAAAAAGRENQQLNFNDELPPEPFFFSLIKEAVWGLRSLVVFLAEQPSQLKYIEWPGFQSTLKTATLTLILVALLIVALSSVDSALSYTLTLLLRRTA